jgi:hypothetical protein
MGLRLAPSGSEKMEALLMKLTEVNPQPVRLSTNRAQVSLPDGLLLPNSNRQAFASVHKGPLLTSQSSVFSSGSAADNIEVIRSNKSECYGNDTEDESAQWYSTSWASLENGNSY